VRLGWWLYTRAALPLMGRLISRDWRDVGAFLGPSVDRFYERYDVERIWRDAGIAEVRSERLTMGAAVVVTGTVA
jgi:ubiquinone/menaquinone biosynthesis C-methylase UbiE